jgi:hypothetical protein
MTPSRVRMTLFAVMAIFLATTGNALFLQDRARLIKSNGLPSADVSVTQFPLDRSFPATPHVPSGAPAITRSSPGSGTQGRDPRLQAALQRELGQHGYSSQLEGSSGLRLAVLAYEFDNGLPLTGEPTEPLLKRVLFDLNQAPRGLFADRAEINPKLVLEIQKRLLELGFFRGTLSGRMDIWTANAVKDFERHRSLPLTGRLAETTLLELISYSGQSLLLSSG